MSKTIASLLFVCGLCVAPLLTGAAVQFTSVAYAAEEEQAPAVFDEDEDIANVDPCIYEETDMATASETDEDIAGSTPIRGTAVAITPVLEITRDFADSAPSKGFAIAQEPEVTESVATFAPSEEDTLQTATAEQ